MRRRTGSPWAPVVGVAVLAGAAWLPFAGRMLSPDEGGILLLGSQWSPGSSLYGDYFVDRPPGLIALGALADAAGGAWALRALGIVAVVGTIVLAGVVGRLAAPARRLAPVLPAATAAVLVANPLLGSTVVNGELLGLPFLVGGFAAVLASASSTSPRAALGWAFVGGVAGTCGALVKQSLLDVFVLAIALLVTRWRPRLAVGLVVGSALTVGAATWASYLRGTDPHQLWDAVVVFRQQAASVIASSATGSTTQRLGAMLLALLVSGVPLLGVALVRSARGRPRTAGCDLRVPALAVLAWEVAVVLLGGSYWLHYLMGLVPGLVLLAAAASQSHLAGRRMLRAAYAIAGASTVCTLAWVLGHPIDRPEAPAIAWLERHGHPDDTAVVAFGGANILQATGMRSPYPDLWSLPVRVHDPDLERLEALLAGPDHPKWLVVAGDSLGTWGVDATAADRYLHTHYEPTARTGDWTIYRSDRP